MLIPSLCIVKRISKCLHKNRIVNGQGRLNGNTRLRIVFECVKYM